MRNKVLVIIVLLIIFIATGCYADHEEPVRAEKGVINLESWDTEKDGTVELDGEWEFYWERLLGFDDLETAEPDLYIPVPSTWNRYSVNGTPIEGDGYGTYRLHVKTSFPKDTMLGCRVYGLSSAYKLYVDGKLIGTNGTVGETALAEKGEYRPQTIFFNIPSGEFDLIMQISNYEYARGGFWYSMHMGSPTAIMDLHDRIMGKEIFLLGALILSGLFFLAIYVLNRELKYSLYFACLCLTLAVSVDLVGQFLLVRIFPGIHFKFVIFLWYSATTWLLFLLILFVHELFPSKFSTAVTKYFFIFSLVSQIVFLVTPTTFYTRFAYLCDLSDIIGAFCTVIIVAIGIKRGQMDGWLNIISMVIAFGTYVHDNLYWTHVINSSYGEILYFGLSIFILLQMIIQANRIKNYQDQQLAAELAFLQAQIKPHFLFNAINTFISISLFDMEEARKLLANFSNYLRRSFDIKAISQYVPLKSEVELVKAYVEIEKARFEERLEVTFEVCDDLEVNVPILILQPVIENAILHGVLPKPQGGRVDISIQKEERVLIFRVKDNGIGMESNKIGEILRRETGGVGLSNINSRLKSLYGTGLQIKSKAGLGTEVIWRIPINKRRKQ